MRDNYKIIKLFLSKDKTDHVIFWELSKNIKLTWKDWYTYPDKELDDVFWISLFGETLVTTRYFSYFYEMDEQFRNGMRARKYKFYKILYTLTDKIKEIWNTVISKDTMKKEEE